MENLNKSLNSSQYQAVTHGEGPVLVIAGAGTGKTQTLVYRMAWLLDQGVPLESILLLTFTRRAAQEMLQRATHISGQSYRQVAGGTFHASANMLLRRYGHHIGISSGCTIIDRGDAEGIMTLLRSSLGLTGSSKRFPQKGTLVHLISGAVNRSVTLQDHILEVQPHLSEFVEDILEIHKGYQEFKLNNALMDYDDLLVNWQRLLAESIEARTEISSQFSYILVDEYQDTNLIQAQIVRLLAYNHDNVMVVGDDAQSIYSFRGADFYNIMRFPEHFPGTQTIKLEQNYRSVQPILALTNAIIAQAQERYTKELFTERTGGNKPVVYSARNEANEAHFIVDKIQSLLQAGMKNQEIAVLFRSGFHSYKLEIELSAHSLDFEKRGGIKLTEAAHIKDALSFFRVLINPWDNLSWHRLLLQIEKIGPKTAQKILKTIVAEDRPIKALGEYAGTSKAKWKKALLRLAKVMTAMDRLNLPPLDVFDLMMAYYEPIFERMYHDDYPKRRRDLEQLKALISGYRNLQSFVDDTALEPPETTTHTGAAPEKLVLSTIHSAKGLEWDVVFVIGLAEGRFPHQKTVQGEQWEEERRLLYVAATRAKKQLFLTYPRTIMTLDRKFLAVVMSPFLREINPSLYVRENPLPAAGSNVIAYRSSPEVALSELPKTTIQSARIEFSKGMMVRHPFFGIGQVKDIPAPRRIVVCFDQHGDKLLHLDYAQLEVMD